MKIGAHHGRGLSETLRLPTMFPRMIRGFLDGLADSGHPVSGSTLIVSDSIRLPTAVSAASFAQMEIALHLGDLAEGSRDDFDQLIPTARVRRCHRAKAVR
jgi:hypothetical protein